MNLYENKTKQDEVQQEQEQVSVAEKFFFGDHDFPRTHGVQELFRDSSFAIAHLKSCRPEVLLPEKMQHGCQVSQRVYPALWEEDRPLVLVTPWELQGSSNLTSIFMNELRFRARRWSDQISAEELWNNDRNRLLELAKRRREEMIEKNLELEPGEHGNLEHHCFEVVLEEIHAPYLFPMSIAMELLRRFRRNREPHKTRVLDISAGWGDRLIACLLSPESCSAYYSCDPHLAMGPCYKNMIETLQATEEKRKNFRVEPIPFEESNIPWKEEGKFDLLLSSPPFFRLEHYGDDPGQSTNRFRGVEEWMRGFLFVALRKCDEALCDGAFAVLHLRDMVDYTVRGKKGKSLCFVQKTLDFCTIQLGWHYYGCIGYTRRKRNGYVRNHHNTLPAQPMWILRKPTR